jgi:hypothetical protein
LHILALGPHPEILNLAHRAAQRDCWRSQSRHLAEKSSHFGDEPIDLPNDILNLRRGFNSTHMELPLWQCLCRLHCTVLPGKVQAMEPRGKRSKPIICVCMSIFAYKSRSPYTGSGISPIHCTQSRWSRTALYTRKSPVTSGSPLASASAR